MREVHEDGMQTYQKGGYRANFSQSIGLPTGIKWSRSISEICLTGLGHNTVGLVVVDSTPVDSAGRPVLVSGAWGEQEVAENKGKNWAIHPDKWVFSFVTRGGHRNTNYTNWWTTKLTEMRFPRSTHTNTHAHTHAQTSSGELHTWSFAVLALRTARPVDIV